MLCASIDLESHPAMLALVEDYPRSVVSVGVHPNDFDRREPGIEELVALAGHPENVAIGETGLDYFHGKGELDWQRERFRIHIRAARQANKPLIIHTPGCARRYDCDHARRAGPGRRRRDALFYRVLGRWQRRPWTSISISRSPVS